MKTEMTARNYHERTKHQPYGYAAGPGYLDWESQPDPFRRYEGAEETALPFGEGTQTSSYAFLFQMEPLPPLAFTKESIGKLFELSFGLAVWKSYGRDRWALRCNPSSGNLHPTESYLLAGDIPDIAAGVYHYNSYSHSLEKRVSLKRDSIPQEILLVGLSSIHWREAWKYGERAYRYCQLDIGHAVAGLSVACASLGWKAEIIAEAGDDDVASLLGLSGEVGDGERESPDLLVRITRGEEYPSFDLTALVREAEKGAWQGRGNVLSPTHAHEWPVIEEVEGATKKSGTKEITWPGHGFSKALPTPCAESAERIIKKRRSAQAFDGKTAMGLRDFARILDMTLPRRKLPPWTALPWAPRVNLLLFVHRVDGLESGLYLFLRDPEVLEPLKKAMNQSFLWEKAQALPDTFPLYLLEKGDFQQFARSLSCGQDIASDSAFSLGMLAEFEGLLNKGGWNYRRLFWESGAIGQMLYLEAEAAEFRGTGIGCYLDDVLHEFLGLEGERFQDMYHFTVGTPLVDHRLEDIPPYEHLRR